ncbi:MAG: hypothetical protein AAB738_00480 [Patescibacteria group bacterium]
MFGNITSFLLIVAAAFTSIIAHSLFRLGLTKTGVESLSPSYLLRNLLTVVFQPLVFAGFVFFGISALIWLRVLSIEPLNKSYPILVASSIFFLLMSSVFVLREPLALEKIVGMVLIILGTFLVLVKVQL